MVQSIDRAMELINVLVSDETKSDWSISELAHATSLPLSTIHRILGTLSSHGLISQDPVTKHYRIGYTWMTIGMRMLDKIDIRVVAKPVMERLAREVEESICLNIPSGLDAILIEKVESPLKLRVAEDLGDRIPLTIGAPNKTMLAHMPQADMERIVSQLLPRHQQSEFIEQLAKIRENGYAISSGERTEGTTAIGAVIMGRNQKVAGALSINAVAFRITDERLPMLIGKVKEAAEEISLLSGNR
ncbi:MULTISPECIES: IclR family transcriptional regulator [Brevibacillus]|jgi:IclR family acetate operon transcriptional repressor|uniref:Transcriptional regulator n=1 Tax=Brevibacillus borstelensis AK1 TaxID=1300222 RepID=M8D5U7_9BACL|nr:IclR family transcriptional regulator [Brevibacillus borstelensis]EMT51634.1 transcriptional regulator [Brevibacillus borstelensis AK1]KKX56614.1 ABC transporter permease [Brevibacillus borstelensis cifa_chp40]MBE5397455.1 IclR family transcriptional regulator [Brevibacillus borstelensis]MCC0562890.1 IclR family transcriptional regulator [Brevibacillus borstelensis]MCM3470339.1 IclR family transcriptional regulator [Brevibacillus borstelensis]